jgi:lipopolysaccharide biosynthesis protein
MTLSFILKKNLKELIGDTLKSQHDWVALYDNYNVGYHAQSFFLCFGHELLRSKAFKTFWRKYRPFNLRHHVINAGELELSRLLIDAGYHCHVMADGSALRERLQSLGASELAHLKNF